MELIQRTIQKKVIESIYDYCKDNNIKITVIAGFGYDKFPSIEMYKGIDIKKKCV